MNLAKDRPEIKIFKERNKQTNKNSPNMTEDRNCIKIKAENQSTQSNIEKETSVVTNNHMKGIIEGITTNETTIETTTETTTETTIETMTEIMTETMTEIMTKRETGNKQKIKIETINTKDNVDDVI